MTGDSLANGIREMIGRAFDRLAFHHSVRCRADSRRLILLWSPAREEDAQSPRRIVLLLTCLPLFAIASLGVVLLAAGLGCISRSAPIYSPSRSMALRIVDVDGGATGGSTSVDLFWAHGFTQQTVYMGGWKSVEPSSIEWKSDTELTVHYGGGYIADAYHGYSCTSTAAVKVRCSPR